MLNKLLEIKTKGNIFLILGVVLLFVGASGSLMTFQEQAPAPVYAGEQVPRELIETAYSAENIIFEEDGDVEDGFVPLYVPQEPVSAPDLPTRSPDASGDDLSEIPAETPVIPSDMLEMLRESYLEGETSAGVIAAEEDDSEDRLEYLEKKPAAEPQYIYIPTIALEARIIPAQKTSVEVKEKGEIATFDQWLAPDEFAVGWHTDSAPLGEVGNTVLNGHHNVFERVFRNLAYLQEGDVIQVYGGGEWYNYVVANKMVLPEWGVSLEVRLENATWIMPSDDERLTLVTCWPEQSNSHRLIIVAVPIE
ncbi:MAG: sortase [Anaerolineaceae bacterium]|nr:sortase [Anaerolineaceae bacterium]